MAREVHPEHPGYLVHSEKDGHEIFVPWNIDPDLPSDRALESFMTVARRVRSNTASAICLSGSAAAYGAFGQVGDLDFCEYLPETERSVAVALTHASSLDGGDFCVLEVSLREPEVGSRIDVKRPWKSPPWKVDSVARAAETAPVGKFDYVTSCGPEGVVEVTNLVLGAGQEGRSHPFQEIALGTWVPQSLARPVTVGNYARFLRGSIRHLVEDFEVDESWKSLVKAAKRAVSLLRLHFRSSEADALLDLLNEERLPLQAALAARVELWNRLTEDSAETLEEWRQPLLETLGNLVSELEGGAEDLPRPGAATDWVEELRKRLDPSSGTLDRLEERLREALR